MKLEYRQLVELTQRNPDTPAGLDFWDLRDSRIDLFSHARQVVSQYSNTWFKFRKVHRSFLVLQ